MTILGVALGALGIGAGLSLGWTFFALVIGNAIGTVFMAAHSAQGPQLGVPQMIQSRAQFGTRGAAIPLLAVVVTYLLYCAANGVLIESAISSFLPLSPIAALIVFSGLTVSVAFVGYELIHRLGVVMTVISTALFAAAAVLLWMRHAAGVGGASVLASHFTGAAFMLAATQAAAWSLSYGPYVADYSRYLPPTIPAAKTFWYTAMGCFLGSTAIMAFGAYLATVEPALAKNPGTGVAALFGQARPLIQVLVVIGVVQGNVLNLYSAYISSVTIFTSLTNSRQIRRTQRLLIMIALITIAGLLAAIASDNFERYFSDALNGMIYLLVPWSAINLADYYLVRRGRYNIKALYDSRSEYGTYRWKTIAVYCVGIAVQAPFMELSFYTGPIAHGLGADIAWLPGLLVPGWLYIVAERNLRNSAGTHDIHSAKRELVRE
jgi:NCS1 family nucleobase:cation symporter-1